MSLIVDLVESIKKYIGNDNYVCSVFIDFEKGFDTADQQILLQKLYHYGIPDLANNWFRHIYQIDNNLFLYHVLFQKWCQSNVEYLKDLHLTTFAFTLYQWNLISAFNKALTIYFADETHLNYVNKKLSTIESVLNYELQKLDTTNFNSGKSELVFFAQKLKKN